MKYYFLDKQNIFELGSIAYKIALVAKGRIDVAISFTKKNDWDLVASDLILKEAGGSLKKTSETTQRQGTAYRIYGCGMMGNVNNPEILIPLEKIVVLSH